MLKYKRNREGTNLNIFLIKHRTEIMSEKINPSYFQPLIFQNTKFSSSAKTMIQKRVRTD